MILSAAGSLAWLVRATGAPDETTLLTELADTGVADNGRLIFLPYLAGDRARTTMQKRPACSSG